MGKWLNKEMFNKFKEKKQNEAEDNTGGSGAFPRWKTPQMGTDKPKVYEIRFLPDQDGNFYKQYYYHFIRVGEKGQYILCPKTNGMDKFCPYCAVSGILFQGDKEDKNRAKSFKRNERYVGNILIVKDPRDSEQENEQYKNSGTVKLYEFPKVIESKVKSEITDEENGYGMAIFDPEEGYNFILKVGSKKPDTNGKVWPEYGDSMFARKSSAIADTDEGIEELMSQRVSLNEYLASIEVSPDKFKELLKADLLFDLVEKDFNRFMGTTSDESEKEPSKPSPKKEEPTKVDNTSDDDDDMDDEDVLNELQNL